MTGAAVAGAPYDIGPLAGNSENAGAAFNPTILSPTMAAAAPPPRLPRPTLTRLPIPQAAFEVLKGSARSGQRLNRASANTVVDPSQEGMMPAAPGAAPTAPSGRHGKK